MNWERQRTHWTRSGVDWTRRPAATDERDAQNALRHVIVLGKAGGGKSTSQRRDIVNEAAAGKTFMLIEDCHDNLAADAEADLLSRGYESRIEIIDLACTKKVIGVDLMPYSSAEDPGQLRLEDDRVIENFAQLLTRERNINLNAAPFIGTWTRNALRLRQRQPVGHRRSLLSVPSALVCGSPLQLDMLKHCTDPKLVMEFLLILEMKNVFQRENIIGPAKRLMEPFFENPGVQGMLSVTPVDWGAWMRQKKIVIVKSNALVSETATRGVMGALLILTIQQAALHYARTGETLGARIKVDEAGRLRLGAMEADFMAQCRKWGVGVTLMLQNFPPTSEFKDILNNTNRLEIFPVGSDEAADFAARQAGTFLLDNMKVKSTEYRERPILRGYKREEVTLTGTSKDERGHKRENTNKHIITTPEHDIVVDEHKLYESLDEQYLMFKKAIRQLATGERIVIDGTHVSGQPEQVIPLVNLWASDGLRKKRVGEALERIRSRSYYQSPDFRPPNVAPQSAADRLRGG